MGAEVEEKRNSKYMCSNTYLPTVTTYKQINKKERKVTGGCNVVVMLL